jgi:hypothetical protein
MATVTVPRVQISSGALPSVCVVCGEAASHHLFPGVGEPSLAWVFVSPLLGLVSFWGYILIAAVSPREGGLPFCNHHRGYWTCRAWFIVGGFLALIALMVAAATLTPPSTPGQKAEPHWLFGAAGLWMLVFLPAFLVIHLSATRPTGGDRDTVTLSGTSQLFADTIEARKARHERLAGRNREKE